MKMEPQTQIQHTVYVHCALIVCALWLQIKDGTRLDLNTRGNPSAAATLRIHTCTSACLTSELSIDGIIILATFM